MCTEETIHFIGLGNSNRYNFQSNTGHCFIRIRRHILHLLTLFALDCFQIPKHVAIISGLFYLRLLQTFAGAFPKKIRARVVFYETIAIYISIKSLLNAKFDKIISYFGYSSAKAEEIGKQ